MPHRLVRRLIGPLMLAAVASTATAQDVTGPLWFDFQGGSGVGFNGWQVGTYRGALDGGPTVNIWCTDFYNYAGDYWVYKTSLGGDDLSRTRWGNLTNQPNRYHMAAWLTSQFLVRPTSEWGYIQYAIWQLMNSDPVALNPTSGLTAAQQQRINEYKALAAASYQGYDYSQMYVLTDVRVTTGTNEWPKGCQGVQGERSCGIQEQLMGSITAVPEPATMGLLALGLVGLALAGYRRRRSE